MKCNCPPEENDSNFQSGIHQMQQQQLDGPSLMVSPDQNQFRAHGYSLCYEDVFAVIAETRRTGIAVVSR